MEILDICDEFGNPTGKVEDREIIHQEGLLHRTAHVWLLRKKNNQIEILLQKEVMQRIRFLDVMIFLVQDISRRVTAILNPLKEN